MVHGQAIDVILRGGTVIDGLGAPGVVADVAFGGDRIVAIGELGDATAAIEIDVSGLVVAPGFIDVHTHDDLACLAAPEMTAKLSQGVTSVIVGNCGISATQLRFDETVPEPFTIADLHRVYAAVWGVAPDLGNFRRKVMKTPGFVVPTDQKGDAEPTGGPRPLLFRRGSAATLQPAMLRPED